MSGQQSIGDTVKSTLTGVTDKAREVFTGAGEGTAMGGIQQPLSGNAQPSKATSSDKPVGSAAAANVQSMEASRIHPQGSVHQGDTQ